MMRISEHSSEAAKMLLECSAVLFNAREPFTFSSGIKSPVYTDCRKVISFPTQRERICERMREMVDALGHVDIIAGTASAGIPHAAWISQMMGKPMIYVRGAAKEHGTKNLIEGVFKAGQSVALIEDTVSTGGSSLAAADVLKKAGLKVLGCVCIYTHGLRKGKEAFSAAELPWAVLCTLDEVLVQAQHSGVLNTHDADIVKDWKKKMDV